MASSIKEVKKKIESTKKTGQITRAMYMVSQSKVKHSEKVHKKYAEFINQTASLVEKALNKVDADYQNEMLTKREVNRVAYLLITSDSGLAGAYNANIFKYFEGIKKECNTPYVVGAIGRKGYGYLSSKDENLINKSAIMIRDDVMFIDIVPLANKFIELYQEKQIDKLIIIYNHYVNTMTQVVEEQVLLPVEFNKKNTIDNEYLFEGGVNQIIDELIPMYVEAKIYGIILDAKISEHCARMNSMKNASDNVDEIVSKMQILYNRARQAAITLELSDIVAGSNAVLKDN